MANPQECQGNLKKVNDKPVSHFEPHFFRNLSQSEKHQAIQEYTQQFHHFYSAYHHYFMQHQHLSHHHSNPEPCRACDHERIQHQMAACAAAAHYHAAT